MESRSACAVRVGKPGGGADALDVEDDAGQLGEIAEPGKLRHQRNARP